MAKHANKAQKRLRFRQAAYDAMRDGAKKAGFKRPGSLNLKK